MTQEQAKVNYLLTDEELRDIRLQMGDDYGDIKLLSIAISNAQHTKSIKEAQAVVKEMVEALGAALNSLRLDQHWPGITALVEKALPKGREFLKEVEK